MQERVLNGYPGQEAALLSAPDKILSQYAIRREQFIPQPNDWTCGAATYCMIAQRLANKSFSIREVCEILKTTEEIGTRKAELLEAVRQLSPLFDVSSGATGTAEDEIGLSPEERRQRRKSELDLLFRLIQQGYLVVINFREPVQQEGHYAIVNSISSQAIEFADPYYGNSSVLNLEKLDWRSKFEQPIVHGWYLAVRHKG